MPIALPRKSDDLTKEHLEKDVVQFFKPRKPKYTVTSIGICFFLSILVLVQNLAYYSSDPSAQFSIEIGKGNNESAMILTGIRSSLQMVTFLAEDFSFTNYTGINDIDTFDTGTKFEFFYNGYRKVSGHPYTRETSGLNIFGVFVEDVGVQLASISKSEDPEKLIHSLTTTFSHTVRNLDEMYHDYKRTGELPGHFDETKLKLGHNAYSIENYSKFMVKFPVISAVTSLISCMTLLLLTNMVVFTPRLSYRTQMAMALVQVPQSLTQFCGWASQLRFYYKIVKASGSLNLLNISLGTRFYCLGLSVLMTLAIQGTMFWRLRK